MWTQSVDSCARATITAVSARKSTAIETMAIQMAILYAPRGRGEFDGPRCPRPPESPPPPRPSLPLPGGGPEWPGRSGLAGVTSVDPIRLPRLLRLSRGKWARRQKFGLGLAPGSSPRGRSMAESACRRCGRWYHVAASQARQTWPGIEAVCVESGKIRSSHE